MHSAKHEPLSVLPARALEPISSSLSSSWESRPGFHVAHGVSLEKKGLRMCLRSDSTTFLRDARGNRSLEAVRGNKRGTEKAS